MLTITIKQIVDKGACREGLINFVRHFSENEELFEILDDEDFDGDLFELFESHDIDVNKSISIAEIPHNSILDIFWALLNCNFKNEVVKYISVKTAIFSAELVLHIYEEKYQGDDRPRKAIEAAKEYLKTKSEESKTAADAARAAAYAAARAAYAAAYAARAAYAADAAGDAAYAAAYAAARAAYAADAADAAGDAAYAAADAAGDAAYAAARAAGDEITEKVRAFLNELLANTEYHS